MIEVKNLIKSFKDGDTETKVLKGIDFKAENGEFIAIMGRSGAGKSTLLYQMSLLDEPTSGQIIIDGHNSTSMSADQKSSFRAGHAHAGACGKAHQAQAHRRHGNVGGQRKQPARGPASQG